MATVINKKLIHFNSLADALGLEYANDANNTTFVSLTGDTKPSGATHLIKYLSIVFIKDSLLIWTHGKLYGIKTIDLSDLDTMGTDGSSTALTLLAYSTEQYIVTANLSNKLIVVGTLEMFSDNLRHVLTQVLTTHYNLPLTENVHTDNKIYKYYRSYNIISTVLTNLGVARGSWSEWLEMIPAEVEERFTKLRGRNLLLNTSESTISNNKYELAQFDLAKVPTTGATYTLSMNCTLGSDRSYLMAYNSGGSVVLGVIKPDSSGKAKMTFNWKKVSDSGTTADNTFLRIYQYPSSGVSLSTISNVKLEEGNYATEWCHADEDFLQVPIKIGGTVTTTITILTTTTTSTSGEWWFYTILGVFVYKVGSTYYNNAVGSESVGEQGTSALGYNGIIPYKNRVYLYGTAGMLRPLYALA